LVDKPRISKNEVKNRLENLNNRWINTFNTYRMKTLKNFIWVLLFVFLFLSNPVIAQVNIVKVTGGKIGGTIENNIFCFQRNSFCCVLPWSELRWRPPHPVKIGMVY